VALVMALWTASPRQASATVYEVDVVADENDGSCTDGDCSLRDAIGAANAQTGPDSIHFDIPGCDPCVIALTLGGLPSLTDDDTTIDGYTQPGSQPADLNTPASLKI
jgi:CSLREA domain-containing protein